MATFTDKADGDWASAGQTTWNEVGTPGVGDTVTISAHNITVSTSVAVGTSGAAATLVVDVTGGSLAITAAGTLSMRGDLRIGNCAFSVAAGGILEFDSSAAAGTPMYKLIVSSATGQANTAISFNGSSGSYCIVRKAASSGNWRIETPTSSTANHAKFLATYTDFSDAGNSTYGFGTNAFWVTGSSSTQSIDIEHCTFTRCGTCQFNALAACDFTFKNNQVIGSTATLSNMWFSLTKTTGGIRIITDNDFSNLGVGTTGVAFESSYKGMTCEGNIGIFLQNAQTGLDNVSTSTKDNISYNRGNVTSLLGSPGDTVTGLYGFVDTQAIISAIMQSPGYSNGSGTLTYDRCKADATTPSEDTDFFTLNSPSVALTYRWYRMLCLPNSRGGGSANLTAHGNTNTTVQAEYCTLMSYQLAGGANQEAAIHIGSNWAGKAGFFTYMRNNLVWAAAAWTSGFVSRTAIEPWTGLTATGASTTTNVVASTSPWAAFTGTTGLGTGNSAAVLVVTGKTGSGPAVGETSVITSNTSNSVALASALSAAPDTGTTFSVNAVDIATQLDYNGQWNLHSGTTSDATGNNAVSTPGYEKFWMTTPANVGPHDVVLASGADPVAGGPQFVDPTRNVATFDTGYLALANATAWTNAHSYSVGDEVSCASSGFYNNATINFTCITAHTSNSGNATNGQPGAAATTSWRTNWECRGLAKIRAATLANTRYTDATLGLTNARVIAVLNAWVEAGFMPRATAIRAASSDGTTIGAVQYVSSGTLQGTTLQNTLYSRPL